MIPRNKLIQLAQIGSRKLFHDDDARSDWKRAKTGKTSFAEMSTEQLDRLVGELRRSGALNTRPPRKAGRVPFNRSPYMAKIEAQLADMGLSWQYAESIAWRLSGGRGLRPDSQPGIKRLEWVREQKHFEGIIAALAAEQKKRGLMGEISAMLRLLDLELDAVDAWVPENKRGTKWQRHLPTLYDVVDYLHTQLAMRESESKDSAGGAR